MAIHNGCQESDVRPEEREQLLKSISLLVETAQDKQTVNGVGGLAEVIADRQHLIALINQQAAELDALRRISLNLTSSLELADVLHAVVSESLHLVKNAHDTHIFLYQDDELTFGAALDEDGHRDVIFSKPRRDGLTFTAARTKEMVVVEDMRAHPLFASAPKDWTGSIISLPLVIGERVVGVMNLARWKIGGFTEAEIRLLKLLADQAAIAIMNARLHEEVSQRVHIDGLTGLPNRCALDERLEEEVKRGRRTGAHFSVVMLDLDRFKKINDKYGHEIGDKALRQIFSALAQTVRSTDFLSRYGGDELTLILPDTEIDPAIIVATKLQEKLRTLDLHLPDGQPHKLSISGGIASFPTYGQTTTELLRVADTALYRAKRSRRGAIMKVTAPIG